MTGWASEHFKAPIEDNGVACTVDIFFFVFFDDRLWWGEAGGTAPAQS